MIRQMKTGKFSCLLMLVVIGGAVLCSASPQIQDQKSIDSGKLLTRLHKLLRTRPVKTDEVVDSLLVGFFNTSFDRTTQTKRGVMREGTTKEGFSVNLEVDVYPDGFRKFYLSLGKAHVLTFEDIERTLIRVRMEWFDDPGSRKLRSMLLFNDANAGHQARTAWKEYCKKISLENPDLPVLDLHQNYRTSFVRLYEGQDGAVFGTFCGYAGIAPDSRVSMVKLLYRRQVTAMRYSLRSPSVVTKLYAAEALLLLDRAGHRLEQSDRRLINALHDSSQMVTTCFGGTYQEMSVTDAFSKFTTQSVKNYLETFKKLGYLK